MREIALENGEYYHIYNRGTEKRDVFMDMGDYLRFLKSLDEFNQVERTLSLYVQDQMKKNGLVATESLRDREKLVEIVAYNLIPNHFHLILKQLKEGGISEFMKRMGTGYTGYFNHKYERSGVLFQGRFKVAHIESNEKLLYLSAYVNGNHIVHGVKNKVFSSLKEYSTGESSLCDIKCILDQFSGVGDYLRYVQNTAKEINQTREGMKNELIEE